MSHRQPISANVSASTGIGASSGSRFQTMTISVHRMSGTAARPTIDAIIFGRICLFLIRSHAYTTGGTAASAIGPQMRA